MNVFKFLSATLLAGTCLFSSCKKEKSIVPENPSVVEITVSNSKGELLGSETVRMYGFRVQNPENLCSLF